MLMIYSVNFVSLKPRCQCGIKLCRHLHHHASAPFWSSLTNVGQCQEFSGNRCNGCLVGVVLLSELLHKCAHVWLALTVSSDLLIFCDLSKEGGGPLYPSLPIHSCIRSMSSTEKGDMPLLGNTSTDVVARQNDLGDRYPRESSVSALFQVFQHFSIR